MSGGRSEASVVCKAVNEGWSTSSTARGRLRCRRVVVAGLESFTTKLLSRHDGSKRQTNSRRGPNANH